MRPQKTLSAWVTVLAMAGATAFAQAPSTPDSGSAAARPFILGPSDVIRVSVWKEADLTTSVTVRPDGKVSLPLVGEVDVAGRTAVAVEVEIRDRLSTYLDAPIVVVIVDQINSPQISVLGEVGAPNRFVMLQQLTVLDAIALAGGFTQFADRDEVIVLRREGAGLRRITVNIKRLLDDGSEAPFLLRPADTVYVR